MRKILNTKWIFILNTAPSVLLIALWIKQFSIIKTMLKEENIKLWIIFGSTLVVLTILNIAYAIYKTIKKEELSIYYSVITLISYVSFMYMYFFYIDKIVPFIIPSWMLSENIILYLGTFLMPTLVYALFTLVVQLTNAERHNKPWLNFLIAILIPISTYLFGQIILPFFVYSRSEFLFHFVFLLLIVSTLTFLFFLIRGFFILTRAGINKYNKYQLAWKIPITIILPLLGLCANNVIWEYGFTEHLWGVFGNFTSLWFYAISIIAGIIICLPNLKNKTYRTILFIARCIIFAYTVYFFLVFLPFLPLAIIAILAIGLGFLLLTPLMLFIIHIKELSTDIKYLNTFISKGIIILVAVLSFLLIPSVITINYLQDKSNLNETLDYIYIPNYSKEYSINSKALQKTINAIKVHKKRSNNFGRMDGKRIPILSAYYNYLVLDNLTLSDKKIEHIEKIFFDKAYGKHRPNNIQHKDVEISKIASKSIYDKKQKIWKSQIDLEITNNNTNSRLSEYRTVIDLPQAFWISDYYLFVGDKKEKGILAEKKTAKWIFQQIENERRDPGIIYYLTGNKVEFKVYPFRKEETRKTGIELLHKEPVTINIDNNEITLGNRKETIYENIKTDNIIYISSENKKSLKKIKRKAYFHFLIDTSKDKFNYYKDFIWRIEKVLKENKALAENAKISFVNSSIKTIPLNKNWKEEYQAQSFQGGFYLDRAIRTTLISSYESHKNEYPIIVVLTGDIKNAIIEKDFSDLEFCFPESENFYNLNPVAKLEKHSLIKEPKLQVQNPSAKNTAKANKELSFGYEVLEYKTDDNSTFFLADNDEPSIILRKDSFEIDESQIKEKNWLSGLLLAGKNRSQILHPETANSEWLKLLKYSFMSKILTPETSYIVVENEAQKAMLKQKQKDVLSGNKNLDLSEEPVSMSEPSLILLIVLFAIFMASRLYFRKKIKKNSKSS